MYKNADRISEQEEMPLSRCDRNILSICRFCEINLVIERKSIGVSLSNTRSGWMLVLKPSPSLIVAMLQMITFSTYICAERANGVFRIAKTYIVLSLGELLHQLVAAVWFWFCS